MLDISEKLTKRNERKAHGDRFSDSTFIDVEIPLLERRLKRVLRGFKNKDVIKMRPRWNGTGQCTVEKITEWARAFLCLDADVLFQRLDENTVTLRSARYTDHFGRLSSLVEAFTTVGADTLTERAVTLLTVIVGELLQDRDSCGKTEFSVEVTDELIFLYVYPEKNIDADPSIGSIILARTLGVELETVRGENGASCYKLTASRLGEYLYEVRMFWVRLTAKR